MATFVDRRHAGQVLAKHLGGYVGSSEVVVLGLPRAIPVAAEVARELEALLDVLVVRKLGLPGFEDIPMGAMGPSGIALIEWGTVARFGVTGGAVASAVARERAELARREAAYRGLASPVVLAGRAVILVDDGLSPGASLRAAITAARQRKAARVTVAVPLCTPALYAELRDVADRVECALTPEPCVALGLWYGDFEQPSDDEVRRLLAESHPRSRTRAVSDSAFPPAL